MSRENSPQVTSQDLTDKPSSWPGALAGSGLFVLAGLMMILMEIPPQWEIGWLQQFSMLFFPLFFLLPPGFYAAGWVKGFPAWSYPWVAHALVWSLYMMNVATPGLRIFNYTFGSNDLWLWRAWIPFLVATAIALLITRSFQPVRDLFTNAWRDWTRVTFALFGFMPLVVMIAFDEIDRLYTFYFMVLLAVVMPASALAYLRSRSTRQQALALFSGIFITVMISNIAPTIYWRGVTNAGSAFMGVIIILLFMFSPALLSLLRKIQNKPSDQRL